MLNTYNNVCTCLYFRTDSRHVRSNLSIGQSHNTRSWQVVKRDGCVVSSIFLYTILQMKSVVDDHKKLKVSNCVLLSRTLELNLLLLLQQWLLSYRHVAVVLAVFVPVWGQLPYAWIGETKSETYSVLVRKAPLVGRNFAIVHLHVAFILSFVPRLQMTVFISHFVSGVPFQLFFCWQNTVSTFEVH